MNGYLLVPPQSAKGQGLRIKAVFFGDGLEKVEGIHSNVLKNIGIYLLRYRQLEIEDVLSFAEYKYLRLKINDKRLKIKPIRSPVDELRQVKDTSEISKIRKSMQIVQAVFAKARKEIKKPGITEVKLARYIASLGLKSGAEDVSFPAIVASGQNAAVPHHVPTNKKIRAGESVIIDFGFKYQGYCSDFTRTVFLKKVGSRKLETAYNQVEKAYIESIRCIDGALQGLPLKSAIRGAVAGDVYQKAADILAEKKLDKYFIHSLGHGTGLEIHELPNLSPGSNSVLKDGMVFSIEPGVYMPKTGGIRIEDLVYLEKGKAEKFVKVSTQLKDNIL